MLSSTRKIDRAPRARASAMSARTRSKSKVWKLRPRISMIEQKLQSNVQPRDVSMTSTCRPSSRVPAQDARVAPRKLELAATQLAHRAVGIVHESVGAAPGDARDVRERLVPLHGPQEFPERGLPFSPDDDVGTTGDVVGLRRKAGVIAADDCRGRRADLPSSANSRIAVRRWNVMIDRPTTSGRSFATRSRTVPATSCWTRTRSATATWWCGSIFPASEVSAPFGIRMATGAMCSNESGIDSSSTCIVQRSRTRG